MAPLPHVGSHSRPRAFAAANQMVAARRPERKVPMKRNARSAMMPTPTDCRQRGKKKEDPKEVAEVFLACVAVGILFLL